MGLENRDTLNSSSGPATPGSKRDVDSGSEPPRAAAAPASSLTGVRGPAPKALQRDNEQADTTSEVEFAQTKIVSVGRALRRDLAEIGYMFFVVPKTLLLAGPSRFLVSSLANVLRGAQGTALAWAASVSTGVLVSGGSFGVEFLWPCTLVVGATHFGGRWLTSIVNYQSAVGTVDVRRNCTSRLIEGVIGQRLNQVSNPDFTQSASLARNSSWVPYQLGNFYYPVLMQASSLICVGATIGLKAPASIIALAVVMTLPSILTTLVNTHLNTADQERYAKATNRAGRLTEYLTSIEYLRSIKIDKIAPSLKNLRNKFIGSGEEAECRRGQVSFYLNTISAFIFGGGLTISLYQIGQSALKGSMDPTTAIFLGGVVLQLSESMSGVVSSLLEMKFAAPYLRALRDIERTIEQVPEDFTPVMKEDVAPGFKLNNASIVVPWQEAPLLEDINTSIEPGTVTTLFGPQGCGKTTLLDFLAGLRASRAPEEIQVIDGEEVFALSDIHPREWIQSIGFCSQHPTIYEVLTLRENITADEDPQARTEQDGNEFITKLLEFVGRPNWQEFLDIPIGTAFDGRDFSGGERQLIAVLRALYKRPKVLFLDEAFTNLPQTVAEHLLQGIRNLAPIIGWQPTVVMVTHDSRHNLYADKIVLLSPDNGGIVGIGTHEQLLEDSAHYKAEATAFQRGRKEAGR